MTRRFKKCYCLGTFMPKNISLSLSKCDVDREREASSVVGGGAEAKLGVRGYGIRSEGGPFDSA